MFCRTQKCVNFCNYKKDPMLCWNPFTIVFQKVCAYSLPEHLRKACLSLLLLACVSIFERVAKSHNYGKNLNLFFCGMNKMESPGKMLLVAFLYLASCCGCSKGRAFSWCNLTPSAANGAGSRGEPEVSVYLPLCLLLAAGSLIWLRFISADKSWLPPPHPSPCVS